MRDLQSRFLPLTIVCLVALPAAAASAQETRTGPLVEETAPGAGDESPLEKRWDLRLSVGVEYDDNILHLRDDRIDEFKSGEFDPDEFLIGSIDDIVFNPRLDLTFSVTPETRRKTRFGFTAAAYSFSDNSIKDYERYQLRFEREFTDTRPDLRQLELQTEDVRSTRFRTRRAFLRANRSRLKLRYTFGPERYLGQLFDDDAGARGSARVESENWDLIYLQRLDRGEESRWSLMLRLGTDEYDYNVEFDERDSDRDRFEIGLNRFQLAEDAYWLVGLSVELAERRSNTALIGTEGPGGTVQDDLSYDGEAVTLKVGRYWYRMKGGRSLYKSSGLVFQLDYGRRDYVTDNVEDLTHYLRDDDYLAAALTLDLPIDNDWVVSLTAEYNTQETNLDPVEGFDRLEPSDYDNFVFGIRISYFASKKTQRSQTKG